MSAEPTSPTVRFGVWLIGARGSVATTAVAGCAAVGAGLHPPTGMVTETEPFAGAGLPTLSSLVFGGHDTVDCPLPKRAEHLAAGGVLPHGLPTAVGAELATADREIRPGGPQPGDSRSDDELIADFAADIRDFADRGGLAGAVVVNVASTEPAPDSSRIARQLPLRGGRPPRGLPVRQLHALHRPAPPLARGSRRDQRPAPRGARRQDRPDPPAVRARADVPPAFPVRAGLVRHEPPRRRRRCRARRPRRRRGEERGQGTRPRRRARGRARGRGPHRRRARARRLEDGLGPHRLRRVPRLPHDPPDDLAGLRLRARRPLVLDLARLLLRAHEKGVEGPLPELGFYFKDPDGDASPALAEQYATLVAFAGSLR